jgi:chlorite dismutase
MSERAKPALVTIDVRERGAARDGVPQTMDRRLFMQLLPFRCHDGASPSGAVGKAVEGMTRAGCAGVVYEDVNDPASFAVLLWSESPHDLLERRKPLYEHDLCGCAAPRAEATMLGRTYSVGYEQDLEHWLLERPRQMVLNENWPWAVWYPLRRSGSFARLEKKDRGEVVHEHVLIGRAYAEDNLAHSVRLACHGLDPNDNELVIGLLGPELHPLSHLVQAMRNTRQTAEFITQMGPFFVGRAIWRSAGK